MAAGSQATATRSGTDESPIITFGIPKGDKGESGEIYQTTGTSTTGAMSQDATTKELTSINNKLTELIYNTDSSATGSDVVRISNVLPESGSTDNLIIQWNISGYGSKLTYFDGSIAGRLANYSFTFAIADTLIAVQGNTAFEFRVAFTREITTSPSVEYSKNLVARIFDCTYIENSDNYTTDSTTIRKRKSFSTDKLTISKIWRILK